MSPAKAFWDTYLSGVRWFEWLVVTLLAYAGLVLQNTQHGQHLNDAAKSAVIPTIGFAIVYLRIPKTKNALINAVNTWANTVATPAIAIAVSDNLPTSQESETEISK